MQYKKVLNPTHDAYAELQKAYDHFNRELFDNKLPNCLITLQREKNTLGYFSTKRFVSRQGDLTDEIAMNPAWFAVRSVREVLSTLAHEQSHQFQQIYGKPGRGRYHNAEWADLMEEIGLMPSDTGEPGGKRTGDRMTHYIIEGGRFDKACDELLTDDFMISWLDRFPVKLDNVDVGLTSLMAAPKEKNASNRKKFSHDCIGGEIVNAWGKPGLKLICGECGADFTEGKDD